MPKSAARAGRDPEETQTPLPPARTRERRINQMVSAAEKLVMERIQSGQASPTEVTAVLRLGTPLEQANLKRIAAQTDLLVAQKAKAEAETVNEALFSEAVKAITTYQGRDD